MPIDYNKLAEQANSGTPTPASLSGAVDYDALEAQAHKLYGKKVPLTVGDPAKNARYVALEELVQKHTANVAAGEEAETGAGRWYEGKWVPSVQDVREQTQLPAMAIRVAGQFAPGAPLVGEPLAQLVEMAGGAREKFNPATIVPETLLSMLPEIGATLRGVRGLPTAVKQPYTLRRAAVRGGFRTAEGAAVGAGAQAAANVAEDRPATEGLGTAAGMGAGMGAVGTLARGLVSRGGAPSKLAVALSGSQAKQLVAAKGSWLGALLMPGVNRISRKDVDRVLPYVVEHLHSTRGVARIIGSGDAEDIVNRAFAAFKERHVEPLQAQYGQRSVDVTGIRSQALAKINALQTASPAEKVRQAGIIDDLFNMPTKTRAELETWRQEYNLKLGDTQDPSQSIDKNTKLFLLNKTRQALDQDAVKIGDPNYAEKMRDMAAFINMQKASKDLTAYAGEYRRLRAAGVKGVNAHEIAASVVEAAAGVASKTRATAKVAGAVKQTKLAPDTLVKSVGRRLQGTLFKTAGEKALEGPPSYPVTPPPLPLALPPIGGTSTQMPFYHPLIPRGPQFRKQLPAAGGGTVIPSGTVAIGGPGNVETPRVQGATGPSTRTIRTLQETQPLTTSGQRLVPTGGVIPASETYTHDIPGQAIITPEPLESVQRRIAREQAGQFKEVGEQPETPFLTGTGNVRRQLPSAPTQMQPGGSVFPPIPEETPIGGVVGAGGATRKLIPVNEIPASSGLGPESFGTRQQRVGNPVRIRRIVDAKGQTSFSPTFVDDLGNEVHSSEKFKTEQQAQWAAEEPRFKRQGLMSEKGAVALGGLSPATEASKLGITFNGLQDDGRGGSFSLFTDPVTRTTFSLQAGETLPTALARTRAKFETPPPLLGK